MTDAAPRRRTGLIIGWVIVGVVLLIIAMAVWVGVRGVLAYEHLTAVQSQASAVRSELSDPAAASAAIEDIAADASAAHDLTSDPIWWVAQAIPGLGPQLAAVSTIAAAADQVAGDSLQPLAAAAASLETDGVIDDNGDINVATFENLRDAAATGADGLATAAASIDSIDREPLLDPLRSAVDEVGTVLDDASTAADTLARTTVLLPAMLGADEPRDYVALFQNNAEWRSLGGIPGAVALLHADNGDISLDAQEASGDFPPHDTSVLPLGDEITDLYTERPGRWIQNVTLLPDFTVTGPLTHKLWEVEHDGEQVDGVLAIDPVALSYLLEATGPVELESGDTLTSENAVDLLLNGVYLKYGDAAVQDMFFATAAASVFDALFSGDTDPAKLLAALTRAGAENRLLLWSADETEQALLEETTLAGGLPVTDADASRFGVFLNDGTGSKMDYYQTADTTVAWESCEVDSTGNATGTAVLTVAISNNAPADAANLPHAITGGGWAGVPAGTAQTLTYIYLPEGFELLDSSIDTGDTFAGGVHEGRRVLSYSVDLKPGESATATVTVRAAQPASARIVVQQTPTIGSPAIEPAVCQ